MICARCREQMERNRRVRRDRIRKGLCYQCGLAPAEVDRKKCPTCLLSQRLKQNARRRQIRSAQ